MTRTKYDWKDAGDFTSKHDDVALWLYDDWVEFTAELVWSSLGSGEVPFFETKLTAEPILLGNPRLYPDAMTLVKIKCDTVEGRIWYILPVIYEIKPTIDSMGAVMRQINDYRQRAHDKRFYEQFGISYHARREPILILVTNTRTFDSIFEDQGVHVLHPEDYPADRYDDDEDDGDSQSSPAGQDTKTKEAL